MRWLIVLLLVSVALAAGEKKPEKRPAKKAHSQKPTKAPKSILDEFTALPPSDVDFIKELDRQFAEHGNKIRIKVERSNGTDGKNIKRTVDGDLGYGHYSNQDEAGYHFSKPKYMIYPYSQHDIPPARATHSTAETVTDIEITPSHSYELKPIEEVYQVYPTQQYSHEQQQQYYHQQTQSQHQAKQLYQQEEAPVIVLKIPGPSKYAAHLQALLQQYLEIRAAQLYKELEEHEYQQQQQHHAQQQQYHQQQQQHAHHYVQEQQVHQHHHHHHQQEQQQQHQDEQSEHEHHTQTKYSQPDPVYPTEIAYVPMIRTSHNTYVPLPEQYYDAPKATARPTKHPNYRKTTVTPTHISFHSTAQPEPAYHYQTYHAETEQQQHHGHNHASQGHTQIQYQYVPVQQTSAHEEEHETHQYVYEKPAINFVTPVPDEAHHSQPDPYHHHHQQQQQQQQPPKKYPNFAEYHHHHRPQQQQEEDYLPEPKLVENYPSHKHTRVVYKSPSLKAELQHEVTAQHHEHDHYHHAQVEQQEAAQFVHQHHPQQQHQQQQYILQEVYPSQASYFEDKSFVESVDQQATTDATEMAVSPHYNTEPVVTITQRPKQRYNYHAHSSGHHGGGGSRGSRMAAANGSTARPRMSSSKASSKRDAIASPTTGPYTEEEFRKVNKMVQRMKKKSRTAIDPATVTVSSVATGSTSPSPSA